MATRAEVRVCRVLGSVMNALMDLRPSRWARAATSAATVVENTAATATFAVSLKTAVGDVELEIPKLRHGT